MREFFQKRHRVINVLVVAFLSIFVVGYILLEVRNSRLSSHHEEEFSAFKRENSSLMEYRASLEKITKPQELTRLREKLMGETYALLTAPRAHLLREMGGIELAMRAQKRDDLLIASRNLLEINEKDPTALRYIKQAKKQIRRLTE